jgi:transporter family-2 protein
VPSEATRSGRLLSLGAAFSVGLLSALQSRMNGGLAAAWSDPLSASLFSFCTGLAGLTLLVLVVPAVRRGVRTIGRGLGSARLRWWELAGGVCGGIFVATQSWVVPLTGVAVFTVGIVAGQSANSLVVDRFGLGPRGAIAISGLRVVAAILAVLSVAVALAGRTGEGSPPVLPVLAALGAGTLVAVQQALNGRVTVASGNAISATWVNFLLGTTLIALLWAATHAPRGPSLPTGDPEPWLLMGGIVGLVFIALAAWSVPRIGVLLTSLLVVAGNLTSSLLLDLLLPSPGSLVNPALLAGVGLAFVAVLLGTRGTGRG